MESNFDRFLRKYFKFIIISFLLIHIILAVSSSYNESLTWGEKCYVGLGKYLSETGNFKIDGVTYHAIFSYYLNGIFLPFLNIPDNVWENNSCWDIGNDLIFNSGYNFQKILFLVRLPIMLLSLLLGYYIFLWARNLYGLKAGLFALLLYAFESNLIGVSRYATTDFPVITFIFIAVYHYWRLKNHNKIKDLLFAGIFTGLALASKETALFLVPIILILGLWGSDIKKVIKNIKQILYIFLIAYAIIFMIYGFQFQTISSTLPSHYLDRAYEEIDKNFPNIALKNTALFVFEKVPIPAPSYFTAIGDVIYFSKTGYRGFLFGKLIEPRQKNWYYFFIVVLVKTPIPLLILMIMSIMLFKKVRSDRLSNELFLFIPIFLLFVTFLFNSISYDLRHILTIFPFILVFTSKVINFKPEKSKMFFWLLVLLLIWYVLGSILAYPNYTPYFNEFVMTKNGHKVLSGSNVDAGQDLIKLKDFMDKNNIKKINLSYLGSVEPGNYGINYDYMPTACFAPVNENYEPFAANCKKDFVEDCSKRKGIVAVSVSNLQNRFLKNTSCFNWLYGYEPIDKLGYAIFIYDIPS